MIVSLKGSIKALKESVDRGGRYSLAYGSAEQTFFGLVDSIGNTERDNSNTGGPFRPLDPVKDSIA